MTTPPTELIQDYQRTLEEDYHRAGLTDVTASQRTLHGGWEIMGVLPSGHRVWAILKRHVRDGFSFWLGSTGRYAKPALRVDVHVHEDFPRARRYLTRLLTDQPRPGLLGRLWHYDLYWGLGECFEWSPETPPHTWLSLHRSRCWCCCRCCCHAWLFHKKDTREF